MKNTNENNSDIIGSEDKLPTFPDTLYPQLPQSLQNPQSPK